jgi:hypothetical protein
MAWAHASREAAVQPDPLALIAFDRLAPSRVTQVEESPYVRFTKNAEHESSFEHNA